MLRFFTELVSVHRVQKTEGVYAKRDWTNAAVVWSGPASVQPDRAFEVRSPERDTSQIRLNVYLPPDADVLPTDRIRIAGEFYEVDGEPMPWRAGSLRHIQLKVWKVRN
ncbi:hypothetical protein [Streptomyces sp. URMC 125]|uniref:hypothetical protein n=1 Tax=Streptomyces sp. URMC 125 TaxID=3423419 RepID=UPI003F1D099D